MNAEILEAIREYISVPNHVHAAACAVRYDLLYGPCFVRIPRGDVTLFTVDDFDRYADDLNLQDGDIIAECYTSPVADALREYIADLPGSLYYDGFSGFVSETLPEPEYCPETDELLTDYSEYWEADSDTIVTALFGKTIAHHFA